MFGRINYFIIIIIIIIIIMINWLTDIVIALQLTTVQLG